MDLSDFLGHFDHVKKRTDGDYSAKCPSHSGNGVTSLSITEKDEKILMKCFAGCEVKTVLESVGLEEKDLFFSPRNSNAHLHSKAQGTKKTGKKGVQGGVQCAVYAKEKRLPEPFLRDLGLSDCKRTVEGAATPSIRIPYYNGAGGETIVRYRISLTGKDKFRWRAGSKAKLHGLYGLWRLDKKLDSVVIVEGESDCHTLWFHKFNAVGIAGADMWNENWSDYFEGFERIVIFIEKDKGGEAVKKWLSKSKIRHRAFLVLLGEDEDPSSLHIKDQDNFKTRIDSKIESAVSWRKIENDLAEAEAAEAWKTCQAIAKRPDILSHFAVQLPKLGLVGEGKNAKLIFLSLVTRLFDRPNSTVIEGPSSAGKSFLVDTVLKFFPTNAYYDLSAMSERALVYTDEPLENRFLVFYESGGLTGGMAEYFIRTLLSEGCLKYEFVEKTSEGLRPRRIEKEGPTGLITTTTKVWRHPENETRLLAITVSDERSQTSNIFESLANEETESVNLEPWKAFQTWLSHGEHRVLIPYAYELAKMTKPVAIRLRRDFAALLSLIKAHALMHRETRDRDHQGRIIATIEDYAVVRDLISEIVAVGVGATVPASVRATVKAVSEILSLQYGETHATVEQIGTSLNIDRSAAQRRVTTAIKRGLLINEQDKKGQRAKIVLGDPLPEDDDILPTVEAISEGVQVEKTAQQPAQDQYIDNIEDTEGACRCAVDTEGKEKKKKCDDCKANGKDGKCYEHAVFRFTHGKAEPLEIAAKNCER